MTHKYGTHEETSKGNPRQLSVWQHVFPIASIRRLTGNTGRIDLHHFSHSKRRFAAPNDKVFCATRAWDQRAESGFMRRIEREYQSVVSEILDAGLLSLSHEQSFKVSSFMALWQLETIRKEVESGESVVIPLLALVWRTPHVEAGASSSS